MLTGCRTKEHDRALKKKVESHPNFRTAEKPGLSGSKNGGGDWANIAEELAELAVPGVQSGECVSRYMSTLRFRLVQDDPKFRSVMCVARSSVHVWASQID